MTTPTTAPKTAPHRFELAGLGKAPFVVTGMHVAKYQACPDAPVQPGSSCDYCGTAIMYVYGIQGADGSRFKVGCDCVAKTGDAGLVKQTKRALRAHRSEERAKRYAAAEAQRRVTREEAAKARRAAVAAQVSAFLSARPDVAAALQVDHPIIKDIAAGLEQFGGLTEKQTALVLRLAREARKVPAPTGRHTFRGEVVSTKNVEGFRGASVAKMTVRVDTPDGCWLAWGTVPEGVWAPGAAVRGAIVELTANLERGSDDHFVFMKRPRGRRLDVYGLRAAAWESSRCDVAKDFFASTLLPAIRHAAEMAVAS